MDLTKEFFAVLESIKSNKHTIVEFSRFDHRIVFIRRGIEFTLSLSVERISVDSVLNRAIKERPINLGLRVDVRSRLKSILSGGIDSTKETAERIEKIFKEIEGNVEATSHWDVLDCM